jgi:hypothetical protein
MKQTFIGCTLTFSLRFLISEKQFHRGTSTIITKNSHCFSTHPSRLARLIHHLSGSDKRCWDLLLRISERRFHSHSKAIFTSSRIAFPSYEAPPNPFDPPAFRIKAATKEETAADHDYNECITVELQKAVDSTHVWTRPAASASPT